jgi:hypothetical protein
MLRYASERGGIENTNMSTSNPLVSVSEIPQTVQPTVEISDAKRIPLSKLGTKRARDSPGSTDDHIRGILGEYAVAKFFGKPKKVDEEIYEYGDPGYDLQINGQTIDVKTVSPRANNPGLMVDVRENIEADYYILVQELNANTYRIIGYAPGSIVKEADIHRIRLEGYAKRLRVVEQYDLFPIPSYMRTSN